MSSSSYYSDSRARGLLEGDLPSAGGPPIRAGATHLRLDPANRHLVRHDLCSLLPKMGLGTMMALLKVGHGHTELR